MGVNGHGEGTLSTYSHQAAIRVTADAVCGQAQGTKASHQALDFLTRVLRKL